MTVKFTVLGTMDDHAHLLAQGFVEGEPSAQGDGDPGTETTVPPEAIPEVSE